MTINVTKAKVHLREDLVDAANDALIQTYIDAATAWALGYCNIDSVPAGADAQFDAAILLTVGDLYMNREASFVGQTYNENPAARRLIDPFRMMRV
ncbi:MAG: head-tail connector protein [Xanthobacteraceae bacterium]